MDAFDVVVTARSNRDLKPEDFARQVAMIKPLMNWDPPTATWHVRLSTSQTELVSNLINTLLKAARVYGIAAAVQVVPAETTEEAPTPPPAREQQATSGT
ncbi:hypothetical protein ACU635_59155 [[Actinomadura] parvosata]|uniref:hypothetical protein n=1 Tax=[Actinomadura] parvosata TaxID=1955412 RepID=UPI00406C1341